MASRPSIDRMVLDFIEAAGNNAPGVHLVAEYYRKLLWERQPLSSEDFFAYVRNTPPREWSHHLVEVQKRLPQQALEPKLLGSCYRTFREVVPANTVPDTIALDGPGVDFISYLEDYYQDNAKDDRKMTIMYFCVQQLQPLWPVIKELRQRFHLPERQRLQHHHIIGAPGSGKTECMKGMILDDINNGHGIIIIDGQGDLIRDVARVAPLERTILVDPTDVEFPICINLFDIGMEDIRKLNPTERERAINGAIDLFDFVFASLLEAQMTSKQATAFRFVTRLMLEIPDATIKTVMEVMEPNGLAKYQKHVNALGSVAQSFFKNEFDSKEFAETRRQVTRRLYALLSNATFEAMFDNPKSKIDLFKAMRERKIILINTAKDFLFSEHATFGRFFIAMIAQAIQRRAVDNYRPTTMLYVDECHEYFDASIVTILEQARKYEVGLILAHQFLAQVDGKLRDALTSIPAIRFASGVDYGDAATLARNMGTTVERIMRQPKGTFLASFKDKGVVPWQVDIGRMSRLPQASDETLEQFNMMNRARYCRPKHRGAVPHPVETEGEDGTTRSKW